MKFILVLLFSVTSAFAQVQGTSNNFIPAGAVMAFALNSCPSGWLKADGSTPLRSAYPRLFSAMGTIHGSGNGTTTFHIPNYQGRFLRMVDGTQGLDPDKASRTAMNTGGAVGNAVGSVQADAFQGHWHRQTYTFNDGAGGQASSRAYSTSDGNALQNYTTSPVKEAVNDGTNGAPRFSLETRVKNATVIFCVKF